MLLMLKSSKAATLWGVPLGIASCCLSSAEAFPTRGIKVHKYKDVFFYVCVATPALALKARFNVKYIVFILICLL
jgi:hypothetical protein